MVASHLEVWEYIYLAMLVKCFGWKWIVEMWRVLLELSLLEWGVLGGKVCRKAVDFG